MPAQIIIVASWYPGVDDPGRGRFVADQAEALQEAGRHRPLVVTFEPAAVDADLLSRPRDVAGTARSLEIALERGNAMNPRAWGSRASVPVTRLTISDAPDEVYGYGREGDVRRTALETLARHVAIPSDGAIVHAHTGYPDGYAAAGLAAALGCPLVITEHASFVSRQLRKTERRRRYEEAVEAAERLIAVSEGLAEELATAIPSARSKLQVIPNVVQIAHFGTDASAEAEVRTADELLFVGYRKERKGMATLLAAFAHVSALRPTATLRLVGRSTTEADEERWHQLARELGVAHAVTFDGPRDRAGVAAAMSRASLFVHPSPRETFGLTTLEALASGLPVVGARSGGISSILEDPALGELVDADDPEALSAAILRTLERRDGFQPSRLRASVEPYAAPAVAGRLSDLYDDVLRGREIMPRPGGTVSAEAAQVPLRHVLVCGLDAGAVAALAPLPTELLARITLLTGGSEGLGDLRQSLGKVIETAGPVEDALRRAGLFGPRGGPLHRLLRIARSPIAALRRRRAMRRPDGLREYRRELTRAAIITALRRSGSLRGGPLEVVCLEGLDHAVMGPLVERGALRPLPGGIGFLADRWWSAEASLD